MYKEKIKTRFASEVVPTLSKRTKDAWASNERITNKSHFKEVICDMI